MLYLEGDRVRLLPAYDLWSRASYFEPYPTFHVGDVVRVIHQWPDGDVLINTDEPLGTSTTVPEHCVELVRFAHGLEAA